MLMLDFAVGDVIRTLDVAALASVQIGLRSFDQRTAVLVAQESRVGNARSLGETAVVIDEGDGSGRRL